ncbi:tail fiber protein [Methylobacterium sp. UNCCL125]|uniref:phage tail protein n=1 Tax=Methylobacterium sp. UNCCL125 TaxID=1502759 RepID=UPI0008E43572|nr:tail fiber protein [Methylobacterium sp. UNCCL125]SFV09073.1 Microcystin-dependent protein [Methylobacterium sp. UNCCL125]
MPGAANWDVAPSGNDVSDPPIIFNEGQPAKTINDAMRALMASVKLWMLDNAGVNQAYGSDAYTVITRQTLSAKVAAQAHTLKFRTTTTNLNPCTLQADGNTPKPWLRSDGSQFGPGDIYPTVWSVVYDPDAQVYRTLSPTTLPAGMIQAFGGPNVPSGWEICDGRPVSRASYAALFGAISSLWGVGDGFQTFNLPDLRGRSLFGANRGLNLLTAAGGLVGSLGSLGGSEVVRMLATQMPSHIHTSTMSPAGAFAPKIQNAGAHDHGGTKIDGDHGHTGSTSVGGNHVHTGTSDISGDHAHVVQYGYGLVSTATPNNAQVVTGINLGSQGNGQTTQSGPHVHTFTTAAAGNHGHSFSTDPGGAHGHGIPIGGDHTHTIDQTPNHTHTLVIDAAGSGDPHPNVPPGAVVTWAIKT